MTKENQPPEPVSDSENKRFKGHPLCSRFLWEEHIERVNALRERHSAYRASLPDDPEIAIKEARMLVGSVDRGCGGWLERARNYATAIGGLVIEGDIGNVGPEHDAALFFAREIQNEIEAVDEKLQKVLDILDTPDWSALAAAAARDPKRPAFDEITTDNPSKR